MAIYVRYALPSLRCHLTVHNLHKIHMEELDLIAQSYIKKWLGIPARGATSPGSRICPGACQPIFKFARSLQIFKVVGLMAFPSE